MTDRPIIILLNGPPRVGKDTIGSALHGLFNADFHVVERKFSAILKEKTHEYYHLVGPKGKPFPFDHYEHVKDAPLPAFDGKSPREAYIHYSEVIMKPAYGDDIFGKLMVKVLEQDMADARDTGKRLLVIVTDSGFASEVRPISSKFGPECIFLHRLRRKGCTFAGDSRSYITLTEDEVSGICEWTNDSLVAETAMCIGVQILSRE